MIVTATDAQNNFGKYLKLAAFEEVIITKNGKMIARLISEEKFDESGFMVMESQPEYVSPGLSMTYEEFIKISEGSEKRYEYIDGELYYLASPSYPHQKALGRIHIIFAAWFEGKKCEPVLAPFDIILFKDNIGNKDINVVQPDIVIICDNKNIDDKGKYKGTPVLVLEILSESTKKRDYNIKFSLYMQSGVKEYWIVNTSTHEIFIYSFVDKEADSLRSFKHNESAGSVCFPGLEVQLDKVFGT